MAVEKIDTRKSGLILNYQLFAEPETGSVTPEQGYSDNQSVSDIVRGIFEADAPDTNELGQVEQQSEQPITEPVQTDTPANGNDDVFEKRYKDVQAFSTRVSQENASLRAEREQLAQQIADIRQQMQLLQQPPQQAEPEEDLTSLDTQTLLDKFYENPTEVLTKFAERAIKPLQEKVMPVVETVNAKAEQDKWQNAIKNFAQKTPDMADHIDAMKQYIAEYGLGNSNADIDKVLQTAYTYARGVNYQPPQKVDIASYLQDPNVLNEYVLNNSQVVDQILRAQAEKMQQNKPPISITSSMGGQTLATPREKPKTMEDGHSIFRSIFRGNYNG